MAQLDPGMDQTNLCHGGRHRVADWYIMILVILILVTVTYAALLGSIVSYNI